MACHSCTFADDSPTFSFSAALCVTLRPFSHALQITLSHYHMSSRPDSSGIPPCGRRIQGVAFLPLTSHCSPQFYEGCASLLSESGFKDFQDRNQNVKRDYFRKGQGAFSPSFESRLFRSVNPENRDLLSACPDSSGYVGDLSGSGDMCHLSESKIVPSHPKAIHAHPQFYQRKMKFSEKC